MTRVARMHSDEMFLLVALAVGLGTAALSQAAGLSLALGAFLAGLIINGSEYAHETLARLLPLRDVFVALFFVTIGALIDPQSLIQNIPLLATMVALIVVGKLVLWTTVVWLFRQPFWTALLVGVGLTQIGEFSFILVQVARSAGHVGAEIYNATLAASLVTILINAGLVRTVPGWVAHLRGVEERTAPTGVEPAAAEHVVLCGFGRVGSAGRSAPRDPGSGLWSSSAIRHRARPPPRARCRACSATPRRAPPRRRGRGGPRSWWRCPRWTAQLVVRGVRGLSPGVPILARAQCRRAGRLRPPRAPPRSSSPSWRPRPP
jgi:hypothetical protein